MCVCLSVCMYVCVRMRVCLSVCEHVSLCLAYATTAITMITTILGTIITTACLTISPVSITITITIAITYPRASRARLQENSNLLNECNDLRKSKTIMERNLSVRTVISVSSLICLHCIILFIQFRLV